MEYGRLLKVENLVGNTVAIVRFRGDSEGVCVNISYVEKSFKDYNFYFFDGKNYYPITSGGEFFLNVNVSSGASVGALNNGEIVGFGSVGKIEFYKEGFCDFEKTVQTKGEKASQNVIYDDFKIAEENYYEKEGLDGKQNSCDEEATNKSAKKREDGEETLSVYNDEKNDCNGEKSGYKPENGNKNRIFRDKIYDEGVGKERFYAFKRLTAGHPKSRDFDNLIPDSQFYFMGEGEKSYLFGAVVKEGCLTAYVYAVPAQKNNPPVGFEKGRFIPKTFFTLEEGFYCLFKQFD